MPLELVGNGCNVSPPDFGNSTGEIDFGIPTAFIFPPGRNGGKDIALAFGNGTGIGSGNDAGFEIGIGTNTGATTGTNIGALAGIGSALCCAARASATFLNHSGVNRFTESDFGSSTTAG